MTQVRATTASKNATMTGYRRQKKIKVLIYMQNLRLTRPKYERAIVIEESIGLEGVMPL